ncbi:MAG: hypothetical protein M1834_000438 [Cirrosporium novae-zelandiae]|nr:MAG: hypothetical protein M1834_000438 [Cirrosporium novae-zelandiae]
MFTLLLLAYCALLAAASPTHRLSHRHDIKERSTPNGSFRIYAYGPNITGLPIFYANSIAYIGHHAPSNISDNAAANLTFSMNSTSLYISPTTTKNWTLTSQMFIVPESDILSPVGFTSVWTTQTQPKNSVSTGFVFYGNQLSWESSDGTLLANFWAEPTTKKDLYILNWNNNNTAESGMSPVLLEYSEPTYITH